MPNEEHDRLDGWKQIADFLGVNVRSALRYENSGRLPVHRVPGGGKVYAYEEELREWLARGDPTRISNGATAWPANNSTDAGTDPSRILTVFGMRVLPVPDWKTTAVLSIFLLLVSGFAYWRSQGPAKPRILGSVRLTHTGLSKFALATDGQRLYFLKSEENHSKLFQVPVTGGVPAEVPTPFQETNNLLDISPDGTRLLLAAVSQDELGVWDLHLPSGSTRRVQKATDLSTDPAAWRPNPEGIVYVVGKELFQTDAYGFGAKKLTSLFSQPHHLTFSPDGSSLRFALQDGSSMDGSLWEASPEGKNAHRLPISVAQFWGGRWTSDGRYFVWLTSQGGMTQLWARREPRGLFRPSGEAVPLSASSLSDIRCVVPSRDGRQLFVIAGGAGSPRLMRFDRSSGHFAPTFSGMPARDLDYSRDARWVAYIDINTSCLWRMRADGTEQLQMTFPPMLAMLPHWSPDGRQIAFTAKTSEMPWTIHTIDTEGGSLRQLTLGESQAGSPTWSPDGKSIVFGDIICAGSGTCAIRLLDLATGTQSVLPGSQGMRTARWSPDGRFIAALEPNAQKVMMYERATGRWEELVHEQIGDALCWSPDSQYLYFGQLAGSNAAVSRVDVRSRKLDRVASLAGRAEIPAQSIHWFGLAPDGSILLVSDARDWDIYALDWEAP